MTRIGRMKADFSLLLCVNLFTDLDFNVLNMRDHLCVPLRPRFPACRQTGLR